MLFGNRDSKDAGVTFRTSEELKKVRRVRAESARRAQAARRRASQQLNAESRSSLPFRVFLFFFVEV
jgi:ubiquitin